MKINPKIILIIGILIAITGFVTTGTVSYLECALGGILIGYGLFHLTART